MILDTPIFIKFQFFFFRPGNNRAGQYIWEDHRPQSGVWKGTSGGEVISFSSCEDDQTSAKSSVCSCKCKRTCTLEMFYRTILVII